MTMRKDMEEAAERYAPMTGCSAKEHPRSDRVIAGLEQAAFREGAGWRVNSLWNGADETPEDGMDILAVDADGFPAVVSADYIGWRGWEDARCDFDITVWAYVDDLMPDRMIIETSKAKRFVKDRKE